MTGDKKMKITPAEIRRLTLPSGASETIVFDDSLPGFGIRLRAGGSQTFVYQYKIGSKQRRITLGSVAALDLGKARDTAKDLYARVRLGQDPAGEKASAKLKAGETFEAIAAQYLRHQQDKLRPRSYDQVQRHLSLYARPLHGLRLDKVTRRDIATCIGSVRTNSGSVTGNRVRATLSAFFTWCLGEAYAESNPVIGTNRSEERPRERVLDATELRLIWNALRDDDFSAIMKLLLLTGQRASEIAGLRWSEIRGSTIALSGERTKNGRPHTIPLSQAALAIIAKQRHEDRDLIFGRATGQYNGWSYSMAALNKRIAEATGHRLPRWVPHDLRRSFATHAAEIGIQPHIIEAVLNHASGHRAGVAGIYNRATYEPEKRTALDRWAAHLLTIVEGAKNNVLTLTKKTS
jgi:integrase